MPRLPLKSAAQLGYTVQQQSPETWIVLRPRRLRASLRRMPGVYPTAAAAWTAADAELATIDAINAARRAATRTT